MKKLLYYFRMLLFIVTLIFLFLFIKNFIKIGFWGYLFFIIEFIYIITILLTILSKKKVYINKLSFNIMNIGTYLYQLILLTRMSTYKLTSLIPGSYAFYRNNYIILSILLIALIFYITALYSDNEKN